MYRNMLPVPSVQHKIVLLGDAGVGKSSLLSRFIDNEFSVEKPPTLGAAFSSKDINLDTHTVKLNIWDTAGQERYRGLAKMYYRDASAAVLVFDLTQPKSFQSFPIWLQELHDNGPKNLALTVAANKSDLEEIQEGLDEEASNWARDIGAAYFRTSAKTSLGVEQLFRSLAKRLVSGPAPRPPSASLHSANPSSHKSKCCLPS